jgi:hypothetical protein
LLNKDEWHRASGYYLTESPWPGTKVIRVFSNVWGPADLLSIKDDKAQVAMGYFDAGTIDSELRYTPPVREGAVKTSLVYGLKLAPTHWNTYKSDGTTVDKVMTGPPAWQIEGRPSTPWTTVNTAIRYLLEARTQTKNPEIKKNADESISELLKLH